MTPRALAGRVIFCRKPAHVTEITDFGPCRKQHQNPLVYGAQHDIQHVYLKEAQALRPDKTIVLSNVDMEELNRWIEEHLKTWRGS